MEEKIGSGEERAAALYSAVRDLLEQKPDDEFLTRVFDMLHSAGFHPEEPVPAERIQIVRVPGKTLFRVDGVEYYSLMDIPDPELRDQARRKLASPGE
jgi:hypothetical protein